MVPRALPYRRTVNYAFTLLTGIICAGLLGAAAAVPAPLAVLPLIIVVCVGVPMLATWQSSVSAAASRVSALDARAARKLRRQLDELPEIQHPLGL